MNIYRLGVNFLKQDSNTQTKSFLIDQERKKYHNKMKKRKVFRFSVVVFVWIILLTYFFMPFSRVKNLQVNGNVFVSEEEIKNIMNLDSKMLIVLVDESKAVDRLNMHPYINNIKVKKSLFKMSVEVKENYPVGYVGDKLLLSNNTLINESEYEYIEKIVSLPIISGEITEEIRLKLISKILKIDKSISSNINSIEIIKKGAEESYYYVCNIGIKDEKIGYMMLKVELNKLDYKFALKEYNFIVSYVQKNDIIYTEINPVYIRYDLLSDFEFLIVENFS